MHSRIGENKPWDEAALRSTLDDLLDGQREINLALVRIDANLAEHMRRTELAEARIEALQTETTRLQQFDAVIGTIFKAAVALGAGAIAVLGAVASMKSMLGH